MVSLSYSNKQQEVVTRVAANITRRFKVHTLDQEDVEQQAWLYLLEHPEWTAVHGDQPSHLYRHLYDRMTRYVEREKKVKDREVSWEAWIGEHDDD